ncbi:iron-enterobactin transporter permease [Paraoerskovia sediminicola]|uniref:Iron-enterobactin transporter permease n=1 Tax=Paraoerskovia sediminicola TaxID=1138587 RepID=A0ABM8G178_9CELL|nr:iron chelate uptake ABC transporter family permease subunit [Paraoerskovia sediminicola]BDZ41806.1 iron-enterobactin transporter permease [Paraoerskovia sediminicola]
MSATAAQTSTRHPRGQVRLPAPGGDVVLHRRGAIVGAALTAVAVLLALVSLGTGDYPLSVPEVVRAMFATDGGFATTVVLDWRLPRVLVALVFGAALGVSGAVFQSMTRNPLGSPEIIGFTTGAYTGALVALIVIGGAYASTTVGALLGGLLTALAVYLLAYRKGISGFRLIIVGIGVTAMLQALNTWLILRADLEVAMSAAFWQAGSIALVGWEQAVPAFAVLAALAVLVAVLAAPMRQLELGDDAARAHGVRLEPVRLALLVVGVALIAVVTAIAGPIAFVSLAAPQIAQRLAGSAGLPLVNTALTGAVLLIAADFVAQHALPSAVPVGLVTVVIGGLYLIGLLVREARQKL